MHRLGLLLLLFLTVTSSAGADDTPGRKFVVFFQEWSAAIDEPAQSVIRQASEWVKSHPGTTARVDGFADPTGSREANILLSDLRAQVVIDQLISDGVDPNQVLRRGNGPVQFALTSQESRRVEVSIDRR